MSTDFSKFILPISDNEPTEADDAMARIEELPYPPLVTILGDDSPGAFYSIVFQRKPDEILPLFLTLANPTPAVIRYSLRKCSTDDVLKLFINIPKNTENH